MKREGWTPTAIGELFESISAGRSVEGADRPAQDDEWGVLTLSAVASGRFDPSANKRVMDADPSTLAGPVKAGTILVSRSNGNEDLVGSCVLVDTTYARLSTPDLIWTCITRSTVDPRWVVACMKSTAFRAALKTRLVGTSTMKKLSMAAFRGIRVLVPSPDEQNSIGELFQTFQAHEALHNRVLERKKRRRALIREQLLRGDARFPSLTESKWRELKLRDVTSESTERNGGRFDRNAVMGVSNKHGLVPMRDRLVAADLQRYKIVPPNGFAYNPMRINVGSIARWTGEAPILVSPDYVVFNTVADKLESAYLEHYTRSDRWRSYVGSAGTGSVRVRIYYGDIAAHALRIPQRATQRAIVDLLDEIDREIHLTERLIALRKEEQRVVLDQLLSGTAVSSRNFPREASA